ncbi:hypothetical protein SDC9_146920 [bioreactor metagenome]|uniref:Uncharacterized protein n=1 Tax=bioreactor metagenome TaxID=1076179 RepID=A0A645EDE1_9ZZZZ
MDTNHAQNRVVHRNGPGQIGNSSVSFLVKVIAPAPNGLPQRQCRNHRVRQRKEIDLFYPAQNNPDDHSGNNTAMYGQPAGARHDNFIKVF